MPLIGTSAELTQVRIADLGGSTLYQQLLSASFAVLLRLLVGVGKSTAVDNLIRFNLSEGGEFDLVILCAPTHRILREREILHDESLSEHVKLLRGRPSDLCGDSRNREWTTYEKTASTTLGKNVICGRCEHRLGCQWPSQFQQISNHHKVVLLPQTYLKLNSGVLLSIIQKAGAARPLIILDEANFAQESFRRSLSLQHMRMFADVLDEYIRRNQEQKSLEEVLFNLRLLMGAQNNDIRCGGWYFPPISAEVAAEIQQLGLEKYADSFYFAGYDLAAFSMQHPAYRDRNRNGALEFRCLPNLDETGGKLLVLSGTVSKPLLEYRLEMDFTELLSDYEFRHESSRFYNLNIGQGVGNYHQTHLPQMVDFAVQYLIRQLRQNKTLAIVTKKSFVDDTVKMLNEALDEAYLKKVRALPADKWRADKKEDLLYIPVLHYGGAIGYNTFEHIDSVLCTAGYYIRNDELNRMVNEVTTDETRMPFLIKTVTNPLRRMATSTLPARTQDFYINQMAQEVIMQEELGVVIQAIGRIRPFTHPREVITCQMGEHPRMVYDQEFRSLKEAREFFGLRTSRELKARKNHINVQVFRWWFGKDATQDSAAEFLGIGKRTVSKYWRRFPERW